MPQDLLVGRRLEVEQAVLRLWSPAAGSAEAPAVAVELAHAVMSGLRVGDGWRTEVSEPAYALGVLRAQEGRDVTVLVENLSRYGSWHGDG